MAQCNAFIRCHCQIHKLQILGIKKHRDFEPTDKNDFSIHTEYKYVAMQGGGHRWEGWGIDGKDTGPLLVLKRGDPSISACHRSYQEERGTEDRHSVPARLFPIRKREEQRTGI
jgi:hypothetical protein